MVSSTMMLTLMGTMYAMPASPRGTRIVRAASGPYAAELSASRPKMGIPLATPTLSPRSSKFASGRPKRISSMDFSGVLVEGLSMSLPLAFSQKQESCVLQGGNPSHAVQKYSSKKKAQARVPVPHVLSKSGLIRAFEETGCSLSAAYAHGHHSVARLAPRHFVGQGANHARTGHAKGMTNRNGSTVDVEFLRINAQPVTAVNHLHGKGFIQLPHVDIIHLQAGPLQQLRNGEDRTDAHFIRIASGNLEAAKNELVRNAQLIGALAGHQQRDRSSIRELRRVSCRYASLAAGLIKMRLQSQQAFEGSIRTVALVFICVDFFFADDLAGLFIEQGFRRAHGSDLALEKSLLLRPRCPLLAQKRIFVLRLAADFVALGHYFSRIAHHHVQPRHFFLQHGIGAAVALRHADAFHAAAHRRVGPFMDDLVRRHGNGVQSRGAEAVDGGSANRSGQTGQHGRDARDVVALGTMRLAAAQNDIFDLFGIELRSFAQHILNAMRGEFIRTRDVERSAKGFGECGPRAGYDNGFSHAAAVCFLSKSAKPLPCSASCFSSGAGSHNTPCCR